MDLDELIARAKAVLSNAPAEKEAAPVGSLAEPIGTHMHGLDRNGGTTLYDGRHFHVFVLPHDVEIGEGVTLPEGTVLHTTEGGGHEHALGVEDDGSATLVLGGEHRHSVTLDVGLELLTGTDGMHTHELQGSSTAIDGMHTHLLHLPDETVLTSLSAQEFYEMFGGGDVVAPNASEIHAKKHESPKLKRMEPKSLELDHDCGWCGERADVAIVVMGGESFAPACQTHLRVGKAEIRHVSEIVAVRRLRKRAAFKVEKGRPVGVLPGLKVSNPTEILERLAKGELVGLLSLVCRKARVGKKQALVNTIGDGFKTAHVWGVVTQEDPIEISSVSELSDDLRKSIAEYSAVDFSDESRLFYLPLQLDVVFNEPIALRRPPGGRRFARDVNFDADIDKAADAQMTMSDLFKEATQKHANDFVQNPGSITLEELSDAQLKSLSDELHSLYGRAEEEGLQRDDIVRACAILMVEFGRRDQKYIHDDELSSKARARLEDEESNQEDVAEKVAGSKLDVAIEDLPAVYLLSKSSDPAYQFEVAVTGAPGDELFEAMRWHITRSFPEQLRKSVLISRATSGIHVTGHKLYQMSLNAASEVVEVKPIDKSYLATVAGHGRHESRMVYRFTKGQLVAELQVQIGEEVLSWKMALGTSDSTTHKAEDVAAAFDVMGSDFNRPLVAPSRVLAKPSLVVGKMAGLTDESVTIDAAKPSVQFGVCNDQICELFLFDDERLSGRLVFKRMGEGTGLLGQWMGRLEDPTPEVLKSGGAMPSLGHSGLPDTLRGLVPAELRFWDADSNAEAKRVRRALAKSFDGAQFAMVNHEIRKVAGSWFDSCDLDDLDEDDIVFSEVLGLSKRGVRFLNKSVSVQKNADGEEERFVFGVVLVPEDVDSQGDIYDAATVRGAAHSFLEHFGSSMKVMHTGLPVKGLVVLESYLSKVEETHGDETFPIGTWFLAVRVQDDDLWEAVKAGDFTGFSIGGTAQREVLSH